MKFITDLAAGLTEPVHAVLGVGAVVTALALQNSPRFWRWWKRVTTRRSEPG